MCGSPLFVKNSKNEAAIIVTIGTMEELHDWKPDIEYYCSKIGLITLAAQQSLRPCDTSPGTYRLSSVERQSLIIKCAFGHPFCNTDLHDTMATIALSIPKM